MTNPYCFVLKSLNIPYLKSQVRDYYDSQPFGNSFYALQVFLRRHDVATIGIKLDGRHHLLELTIPAIVVYDGRWAVVKGVKDGLVSLDIYEGKSVAKNVAIDLFLEKWDGSALIITALPIPQRTTSTMVLRDYIKYAGLFISLMAMVIASIFIWDDYLLLSCLVITNSIGLAITVMLLQKQLHINNRWADKICSLAKESICESVTESDGANVFGLVKLSEVGFGFFIANIVVLFAFPNALFLLAVYAAAVLPFSFWSIWYQKQRAKSWCMMCLRSLALMWVQAGEYAIGGVYQSVSWSWLGFVAIGAAYVLSVLLTNRAMSVLEKVRQGRQWHHSYELIKADEKTIETFEGDAPRFDTSPETCSSLLFGNPLAKTELTIFSNPYCGPCAAMHQRIKTLPGNCVSVRYVMTCFSEDKSDVNRAIIAAYFQLGHEATWQLLARWFAGGKDNGIDFFTQYNLDLTDSRIEAEFARQNKWKQDNQLYGTPTDIVNGREIRWPYTVEDCFYL